MKSNRPEICKKIRTRKNVMGNLLTTGNVSTTRVFIGSSSKTIIPKARSIPSLGHHTTRIVRS